MDSSGGAPAPRPALPGLRPESAARVAEQQPDQAVLHIQLRQAGTTTIAADSSRVIGTTTTWRP
jgi:hypothetical protein